VDKLALELTRPLLATRRVPSMIARTASSWSASS